VDIALGPWTAEMSVDEKQRKALAAAMGDAAWDTVKNTAGFTPKKAADSGGKGFGITGRVINVLKQGGETKVQVGCTLIADGGLSNVKEARGEAAASGGASVQDALEAVTEAKVKQLLNAIKTGTAKKYGG